MTRPVLALLTDFGEQDHYVAAMKAVALRICPDATLLDISHQIPPQDVLSGALELRAVAPYLPSDCVVLGVVDPGVGSRRRGVAIEAGGLRFVGPDNGLFSLVLKEAPAVRSVEIVNPAFVLDAISATFEGRDRFAPAAAWLAKGTDLGSLGPTALGLVSIEEPTVTVTDAGVDGIVMRIDRFGNLVTNIEAVHVLTMRAPCVCAADVLIPSLSRTYADVQQGALCALFGSTGRLEVSLRGGDAAARLGLTRGARVSVRPRDGA